MNTRERFVKTLSGEKVDRVPFIKVFGGTNAIHPEWEAYKEKHLDPELMLEAGNDVAETLLRYPSVGIIGGLRKESMYEGKEAIDREMDKARELVKKGRYIPGPDHFVLKLANFENYRYFMESLREVVLTTTAGN